MASRLAPSASRALFAAVFALVSAVAGVAGAATITVTTLADDATPNDGSVSLREAIIAINAGNDLGDPDITAQNPGTFGVNDTINFNIPGAGVKTIQVGTDPSAAGIPLPTITKPITINGYSQPGSSASTLATGDNAVILVEIDGSAAGTISTGLIDVAAGGSTIRGLAIVNAEGGDGISLSGGGALIAGNFIGLRPDGTTSDGNACVGVRASSSNNTIGGSSPGDRNVISGITGCGNAGDGIRIELGASGNLIQGNFIGTDPTGTASRPNTSGISILNSPNNVIGGTIAGARNLLSGNRAYGVSITALGSTGNVIQGNFIGTDVLGMQGIGNSLGINLESATNTTIGGTVAGAGNVISGNQYGLKILYSDATGNTIAGNLIGLNVLGNAAIPNVNFAVWLLAPNNVVGSTIAGGRNVISGNGVAIEMVSNGTQVLGNFIGTDSTGMVAIPNGYGISDFGSSGLVIGTSALGGGNVISGNLGNGITLQNSTSATIRGNIIGLNAQGETLFPLQAAGINLQATTGTVVGGVGVGDGNVISSNSTGILVNGISTAILGNKIGTDLSGTQYRGNNYGIYAVGPAAVGNGISSGSNVIAFSLLKGVAVLNGTNGVAIRNNRVFANGELGIDLGADGPTPNDPGDADTGANGLQNFPLIRSTSVNSSNTTIIGSFNSMPSTTYTLEFYSNPACSPSSYGEGKTFLGSAILTTDASGNASFNLSFATVDPSETVITATATDPNGNTSEFSACEIVPAKFYAVTPCRVADTRNPAGPYGGPALAANADRTFVVGGPCAIPSTATAVAFNFTITQPTGQGDLRIFPAGGNLPLVSTLNWRPGQTRANNAVVALGPSGDITVHVDQASGTVQFLIDVSGYFQ